MELTQDGFIPNDIRRNHWMNQIHIHASAEPRASRTAFKHRGVVTTWADLAEKMDRTAAAFQRRGLAAGDRVIVLTLNHLEAILAVLGPNEIGAIGVPINARLTPAEVAYIVDDADADVIVVDEALVPVVKAVFEHTQRLKRTIVVGDVPEETAGDGVEWESFAELEAEPVGDFVAPDVPEDTVCLIMYTSGTTGRPKGAMLDHVNMFSVAMTTSFMNGSREGDVNVMSAPLFHIAAWGSVAAIISRADSGVIYPLGAMDPIEILDAYEAEGATVVFNVPQMWQVICAAKDKGRPGGGDWNLSKLRTLAWGAAPSSESILRAMSSSFPGTNIVAAFGQTELSPITCVLMGDESLRKIGSVGRPVPPVAARVVGPDMEDVAQGEVGELIYRGPSLMRGYWRRPDATAEAFAGGWFHSGDLVRVDEDGFVYVVDRVKDMVISGGENIYCTEVENVLFDHPSILEAAVFGRESEKWGEIPVAAVVLREDKSLTIEELREWLNGRLARYKHPQDLTFVDALPRNASGKVRKVELREA
jgi:fatty-acyl-CoA synthase